MQRGLGAHLQLAEGDVLVHPGLGGQTQNALADDVVLDLVGPSVDRVRPAEQEETLQISQFIRMALSDEGLRPERIRLLTTVCVIASSAGALLGYAIGYLTWTTVGQSRRLIAKDKDAPNR